MKIIFLTLFICFACYAAKAQQFSIATNALGYASLFTMNGEIGYGLSQNFSLTAQAKYNPWQFYDSSNKPFQNKQLSYSLGARYWPWHINSAWFFGAKAQYTQYSIGGIRSPLTKQGDAIGIGTYAGWSYMISKWLNLEFGAGFWCGMEKSITYACPNCGTIVRESENGFIRINDIILQIAFVF